MGDDAKTEKLVAGPRAVYSQISSRCRESGCDYPEGVSPKDPDSEKSNEIKNGLTRSFGPEGPQDTVLSLLRQNLSTNC
jgi:hypothetical protein